MNLHDYLATEHRSFDEFPFSPLDSAVLTQACMVNGSGAVPPRPVGGVGSALIRLKALFAGRVPGAHFPDLAALPRTEGRFTGLAPYDIERALDALAANPRFNGLEVIDYADVFDEGRRTQFSATAYVWRDDFAYVAFRGTDRSLTGWHENFDMTYLPAVPAQTMARAYLEAVAAHLPRRLYVGGHSKGGNLALFAAFTCSDRVRERIERVWCHDSPGFKAGLFGEADYARLEGRIYRDVPQESVVGMLMEHLAPERVVRSYAQGLMQHSVFTWEIADGDFIDADGLTEVSRNVRAISAEWLSEMGEARRAQVVDALFAAIAASGMRDAGELLLGGPSAWRVVFDTARNADADARAVLNEELGRLTAIIVRRLGHGFAGILR